MKKMVTILGLVLISSTVFASGTEPIYQKLAEKTVQHLHSRKGDSVSSSKTSAEYVNNIEVENYEVTLSNPAGSAVYSAEITVTEKEQTIKIKFVDGN